ncbi:phasin family protein [Pelotalea chapellei]|uniref:Phasin family protein n=1 Tax=Pelotalea chapellei TaxID=44671 RepID=A0ABS5UCI8_9BACT|nr:phasin family protein [Pelotalea chapellei]MBT1073360.1 phasin family protein [Pelotalea chapellei]
MFELLEKAVLTTIGAAALTQKKAEELVSEMKDKYKMTEEEGRGYIDRLQSLAKESRGKIQEMADFEVQKAVDRFGLVTREEFERLEKRIQILECKSDGLG